MHNINWNIGDVANVSFDDSSFSIVVTRCSFYHFSEQEKVLEVMKRVCSTGGKVIVIDVTPDSDKNATYNHVEKLRDCSHVTALTLAELQNMMKKVGLVNLKVEYHDLEMKLDELL